MLRGLRSKRRSRRLSSLYAPPAFAPKLKHVKLATDCNLKKVKVENYPDVPPGFPPKCGEVNDKKNISMGEFCTGISQTMAFSIAPPESMEKNTAEERSYTFPDYAHDRNKTNSVAQSLITNKQKSGERTSCFDINLPSLMDLEARLGRVERLVASHKSRFNILNTISNAYFFSFCVVYLLRVYSSFSSFPFSSLPIRLISLGMSY